MTNTYIIPYKITSYAKGGAISEYIFGIKIFKMETQTQNEILPNVPTTFKLNYYSNEKPKTGGETAPPTLLNLQEKKIYFTFPLLFPALLYGTLL